MQSHRFPLMQLVPLSDTLRTNARGQMPHGHSVCAHTPAHTQTLPCTDPERAPLAQAQSIQRWRQRDAFTAVKPHPASRATLTACASLPASNTLSGQLLPTPPLEDPACSTDSKDPRGWCPAARHQCHPATLLSGLLHHTEKGPSVPPLLPRRLRRTELQTPGCHGSGGE